MPILAFLYQNLFHRDPPTYLKKYTLIKLIWKMIRKTLNVSIIPFIPFTILRILLYRLVGYKIGKNVFIGMMCYLDDSYPQLFEIEDNVTISYRVTFSAHGRRVIGWKSSPIILKEGCYIGTGAIILRGVTVGRNATVGAGAVVTHDVPENITVVGVPAREL